MVVLSKGLLMNYALQPINVVVSLLEAVTMSSAAVLISMADGASCLQVVHHMGSQEAITECYLPFPKAAGLLGAADGEFAIVFWHERFLIEVPEELVLLVSSELEELEMRVRGCHCCLQLPIPDCSSCRVVLDAPTGQGKLKRCCLLLMAACSCCCLPAGECVILTAGNVFVCACE